MLERRRIHTCNSWTVCVCVYVCVLLTQSLCDGVYKTLTFILHILLRFQRDGQEAVVLSVTHMHLHT